MSNSITNGLSAGAVSAVGSYLMPDATSLTTVALASAEAAGDPDGATPDGAADPDGVANSSAQQAGYGVAPGAGL